MNTQIIINRMDELGFNYRTLAAVCTGEKSAADVIDAARQEAGSEC